jgi:hypothetical protein
MSPLQLLDNTAWHSLIGPHATNSAGSAVARRYARGFAPIIAFADAGRPDFAALEPHCEANERFYCAGWSEPVPVGRQLHADKMMLQMVWRAPPPAEDDGLVAVRLAADHVPQIHVMRDNRHAHALYQRMGFEDHQELAVRVLSRSP